MIIKDKVNDLYEVMAKEDKEKKYSFTTALKGKHFESHITCR